MLYVNTKNKYETYTAYQAFSMQTTGYSGAIAPIRLPSFSDKNLYTIYKLGFSGAVAFVLKKFFSNGVSAEKLDSVIDFSIVSSELLDRKTMLIRFDGKFTEVEKKIYALLVDDYTEPTVWGRCAIRISLLFGLWCELIRCGIRQADFAVASDDLLTFIPVLYGKIMGLPVNKIILGDSTEDAVWNFVHKGQEGDGVVYEYLCHGLSTAQNVLTDINSFVVSRDRAEEIIANVGSTYKKEIDLSAAFSYGALQDYRAVTGENRTTIVFSQ